MFSHSSRMMSFPSQRMLHNLWSGQWARIWRRLQIYREAIIHTLNRQPFCTTILNNQYASYKKKPTVYNHSVETHYTTVRQDHKIQTYSKNIMHNGNTQPYSTTTMHERTAQTHNTFNVSLINKTNFIYKLRD